MKLKIVTNDRLKGNAPFEAFLRSLPDRFNGMGREVHQGRNAIRIIDAQALDVGYDQVCVKRYHGLLFFQKWDYTWRRPPKCRRAFENTAELRRRGFNAAEELAYVEVWHHGLFQYGFFVSAVAVGERLDNLVIRLQEQHDQATIEPLIHQYATLVRRLHERGVLYWDMNCGNVICQRENPAEEWTFTLIDTNRVRLYPAEESLDLDTVIGDLVLMNPKMGTVEMFIADYLRQRGLYSEAEARRVRQVQYERYEKKKKKRTLKKFFKRFNGLYYKWLEK